MKIIENLIKILIVLLLLFLLIQNSDQRINLQLFTLYYPNVNVAIVLLITLGIGAILGAVMLSFNVLSLRSEIRNIQKKNKQLTRELENLRNISIEEIPDGDVQDVNEKKESS
jgi:uncharacterized integral membrane protein